MIQNRPIDLTSKPLFRILIVSVVVAVFSLIVVGITLRVSESGSTCPDWPTCFGQWTPPANDGALIAYAHRFFSLLAGLLLLLTVFYSLWHSRQANLISLSLSTGLLLSIVQIGLGRVLVDPSASPFLTALHLGLALTILTVLLFVAILTFSTQAFDHRPGSSQPGQPGQDFKFTYQSPFARLSVLTALVVFLLLVSGAWLSAVSGDNPCSSWPLCNGFTMPVDLNGWIDMIHRLMTALTSMLAILLLIRAWRTQRNQTAILVSTTVAIVLFFSQALMGAVETAQQFPDYMVGLHTATAVAVWAAISIQVSLVGISGRAAQEDLAEAQSPVKRNPARLAKDYLMLTKPIVVALLLVTTFAGMVVGDKAWPSIGLVFWTLLGGAMAAGGSGAINQFIDRHDDGRMQRTSRRPIPSGRLTPAEGLAFGVATALISFYLMVTFVNFLAALLTLAGIIYYVLLYSIILKKTTVQNIVIGGGAGAIPPLVGWAAATGSLNVPSLFLFAVVFMWTPPHFWALALVRRQDYARVGVPMLPVVKGEKETRWQILIYTIELVALTLVLPLFGLGGGIYFVAASVLGGALLYSAWNVWRREGNKVAWMMYRHSSMYLACLFVALMVDALI
jgi:protoheme IX farnesyltransferase